MHMENFIRPSSAAGTRRAVGDNGYVALHTLLHSGLSGLQLKVCGGECSGDLEKENTWTSHPLPPVSVALFHFFKPQRILNLIVLLGKDV